MTREELTDDEEEEDLDDYDAYDEDLDDGEDDDDEITGIATVERLSSVEAWEMYRLVNQDTGLPIASIAVGAPRSDARVVEYAVWHVEDVEEPGSTGSVSYVAGDRGRAAEWDDDAREDVLREVLYRHEEDLGIKQDKADFRFEAPEGGSDEEDPEDEG
jgi:hypothetical protein